MSNAKEKMLHSVRSALQSVPNQETPADVRVPRNYSRKGRLTHSERVDLFVRRVKDYKATIRTVAETELTAAIIEQCHARSIKEIVRSDSFPYGWDDKKIDTLIDTPQKPLSKQQLDSADGVITTCSLAIANTGTILLDTGPGQGRRILTLVPDYHLCVINAKQIVETVPEAFSALESTVKEEKSPITFISGPSATSDIELNRVEGVHGPRTLDILLIV